MENETDQLQNRENPQSPDYSFLELRNTVLLFLALITTICFSVFGVAYLKNHPPKPKNIVRAYPTPTPLNLQLLKESAQLIEYTSNQQIANTFGNPQKIPPKLRGDVSQQWSEFRCIKDLTNLPSDKRSQLIQEVNSNITSTEMMIKTLSEIENHRYSLEMEVMYEGGQKETVNKGETAEMNIYYDQICQSADSVVVLYNIRDRRVSKGFVPQVHAGGGMANESVLAIGDIKSGKVTIYQKLLEEKIRVTVGSAYMGCRKIIGINEDNVMIVCGGGDGPHSAFSLVNFNSKAQSFKELANCEHGIEQNNNSQGEFFEKCVDQNKKTYFYQNKEY